MELFDIKRFIGKIRESIPLDDVVSILEKLSKDPTLNKISENAGTVGGIIKIALHITEMFYQAKVPEEKRLSLTLIRIMLGSARDSLPYSVSNVKLEEIFDTADPNQFQSIVLELFDAKYYENSNVIIPSDLREHPVFIKFKDLLRDALEEFNHKHESKISIPQFLIEFDSNLLFKLEEEKKNNASLNEGIVLPM
jgi:hypothetical protein